MSFYTSNKFLCLKVRHAFIGKAYRRPRSTVSSGTGPGRGCWSPPRLIINVHCSYKYIDSNIGRHSDKWLRNIGDFFIYPKPLNHNISGHLPLPNTNNILSLYLCPVNFRINPFCVKSIQVKFISIMSNVFK